MFEEAEPDDRPTCPRCGKPFLAVCEDYIPIVLYFCDKHGWHFMAEAVLPQKWSAADSIH